MNNVFCCTEPPRIDPKSAFVVVTAVRSAPFCSQTRKEMAVTGGFLAYTAESKAVGLRLEVILTVKNLQ